jgi:hypothetical protein
MRPRRHPTSTSFALIVSTVLALGGCGDDSDDSEGPTTISYVVSFNLEQTTGLVGALQFEVKYLGDDGDWLGAKAKVRCTWRVVAAIKSCTGKENGRMTCAIVDSHGFVGPTALMECDFISHDGEIEAADFRVSVVDALGSDLTPIDVDVTIKIDALPSVRTTDQSP